MFLHIGNSSLSPSMVLAALTCTCSSETLLHIRLFSHFTWWLLLNDKRWLANQPACCSNTPRQSLAFQEQVRHPMPWSLVSFFLNRATQDASEWEKHPTYFRGFRASSDPSELLGWISLYVYTPEMFGVASIQLLDALFSASISHQGISYKACFCNYVRACVCAALTRTKYWAPCQQYPTCVMHVHLLTLFSSPQSLVVDRDPPSILLQEELGEHANGLCHADTSDFTVELSSQSHVNAHNDQACAMASSWKNDFHKFVTKSHWSSWRDCKTDRILLHW